MNEFTTSWMLDIVSNTFKVVIMYYYLKAFLGFKENIRSVVVFGIFASIFAGFQYMAMSNQEIGSAMLLGYVALAMFIGSFFCRGSLLNRLLAVILFITLMMICEFLAGYILSIFGNLSFAEISTQFVYLFTADFISNVLAFVMVRSVAIVRRASLTRLSFKFYFTIIILPLSSIVVSYVILKYAIASEGDHLVNTQMFGILGLMISNISVFSLFEDRLAYTEKEQKMALLNQALEAQITSYEELEEQQISTRKLRHDMRNYLNALAGYIQTNDAGNAMEYIESMSDSINQLESVANTGIVAVDAIISTKYNTAKKKGISLDWRVTIPDNLQIDSMDICLVLGNALDNAIEACERNLRNDNKKIVLEMMLRNDYLVIHVINVTEEDIKIVNGTVPTSKRNKAYHGFGLENIRNIAIQYGGNMVIEYKDSKFYLNVILQNLPKYLQIR